MNQDKRRIYISIADADRLINQPLTQLKELAATLALHGLHCEAVITHEHFSSGKFFPTCRQLIEQGRLDEEMEPEGLWLDADDVQKFGSTITAMRPKVGGEGRFVEIFWSTRPSVIETDRWAYSPADLRVTIEQTHAHLLGMLATASAGRVPRTRL